MAASAATTATPPFASRQRGGEGLFALSLSPRLVGRGHDSNALFASQSQSFLQGSRRFLRSGGERAGGRLKLMQDVGSGRVSPVASTMSLRVMPCISAMIYARFHPPRGAPASR